MSRVHDALRRAGQENPAAAKANISRPARASAGCARNRCSARSRDEPVAAAWDSIATAPVNDPYGGLENLEACIQNARRIQYNR